MKIKARLVKALNDEGDLKSNILLLLGKRPMQAWELEARLFSPNVRRAVEELLNEGRVVHHVALENGERVIKFQAVLCLDDFEKLCAGTL